MSYRDWHNDSGWRPIPGTPLAPTVYLPMTSPCTEPSSALSPAVCKMIDDAAGDLIVRCGCGLCNPSRLIYPAYTKLRTR